MNNLLSEPCEANDYLAGHAELLITSYHRVTGKSLVDTSLVGNEKYGALYNAAYCVVSHNTLANPIFNYGNKAALRLFQMGWDHFTQLPSRQSAEPENREERARLLERVTRDGFIDDYRGIRISSTGTRFWIEDATVWNIIDEQGEYMGQAAVFHRWTKL